MSTMDPNKFTELVTKASNGQLRVDQIRSLAQNGQINTKQRDALFKVAQKFQVTQSTATKTSGLTSNLTGALGETYGAIQDMTGGATMLEETLIGLGKQFVSTTNQLLKSSSVGNLTTTSIEGMIRSFNTLSKTAAIVFNRIEEYRIALNKSGVDGRKFILELRRQQDALTNYYITFDKLNQVFVEYQSRLSQTISSGYPAQREALMKIAAINEKFGVSISTTTEIINQLDTGMQLSANQTDVFSRRLQKFAIDTGQPVTKVFSDFAAAAGKFFVELDPDKALKKFTIFQQVARRLGTDVSQLTQLTDNFETIDKGMEFGGNLNMLLSNLGGSFDAVQATLMSQPERMRYIAEQVGQVGDRIRGMSDFGQRAILRELATQLGVDVGMVRSLINKDKTADIQRFIDGTTNLAAMGVEEQAARAREMTTRTEKVQTANDKMISSITVAGEKLAQSLTDAKVVLAGKGIEKAMSYLEKFAPEVDKLAGQVSQFATSVQQNGLAYHEATKKQVEALNKNTAAQRTPGRGQTQPKTTPQQSTPQGAPMSSYWGQTKLTP